MSNNDITFTYKARQTLKRRNIERGWVKRAVRSGKSQRYKVSKGRLKIVAAGLVVIMSGRHVITAWRASDRKRGAGWEN